MVSSKVFERDKQRLISDIRNAYSVGEKTPVWVEKLINSLSYQLRFKLQASKRYTTEGRVVAGSLVYWGATKDSDVDVFIPDTLLAMCFPLFMPYRIIGGNKRKIEKKFEQYRIRYMRFFFRSHAPILESELPEKFLKRIAPPENVSEKARAFASQFLLEHRTKRCISPFKRILMQFVKKGLLIAEPVGDDDMLYKINPAYAKYFSSVKPSFH